MGTEYNKTYEWLVLSINPTKFPLLSNRTPTPLGSYTSVTIPPHSGRVGLGWVVAVLLGLPNTSFTKFCACSAMA